MKKLIIFLLICILASETSGAQTVYSCQYRTEADVKVYVAKYRTEADLIIYFVDYRNEAGWRNKTKKQLMY